jgi:hypothetical protein
MICNKSIDGSSSTAATQATTIADITGLQAELDAKALDPIAIADVTGLQTELDAKAVNPTTGTFTTDILSVLDDLTVSGTGAVTFNNTGSTTINSTTTTINSSGGISLIGTTRIDNGDRVLIFSNGTIEIQSGGDQIIESGGTFTANNGANTIFDNSVEFNNSMVLDSNCSLIVNSGSYLQVQSGSHITMIGRMRQIEASYTVTGGTIPEPLNGFIEISNNSTATDMLVTAFSDTVNAIVTIGCEAGITCTINGTGNFVLKDDQCILSEDRVLTVREKNGSWYETSRSHPTSDFSFEMSTSNLVTTLNSDTNFYSISGGYPFGRVLCAANGRIMCYNFSHEDQHFSGGGTYTGSMTLKLFVNRVLQNTTVIDATDATINTSSGTDTAGAAEDTWTYSVSFSPIPYVADDIIEFTCNIFPTNLTTGMEASVVIFAKTDF